MIPAAAKKIIRSGFSRTAGAVKAFVNPVKAGYAMPVWLDGRETFNLANDTPAGIFRNLYEFEMTATEREWKQLLFYYEMALLVKDVPGHVAEFGVSGGVSLMAFTRLFETIERGLDSKEIRHIYGFDSFEGLPALHSHDVSAAGENQHMKKGGFIDRTGHSHLLKFAQKFPRVHLVKGWFSETLPVFLRDNPAMAFALVHIDCDLYESTKDVLTRAWDHVTPGGIVVFDELYHKDFPGETKAFREFFDGKAGTFTLKKSTVKPDKKYIVKH